MTRTTRQPTYCTPDDVAAQLDDLSDPENDEEKFHFSDDSHPSYDRVCTYILAAEDLIDRNTKRSWRQNKVRETLLDIPNYQWDENAWRSAYYQSGGYAIHLAHKNVLEWDPTKGDKLELRTHMLGWRDISDEILDNEGRPVANIELFWFDYKRGTIFLKTRLMQQKFNALRVTYRYGNEDDSNGEKEVPAAVNIATSMMAAKLLLSSDFHSIKVGIGGDISGLRDQAYARWDAYLAEFYLAYRRTGIVKSLYR